VEAYCTFATRGGSEMGARMNEDETEDAAEVTIAALLNLVRLMGAELVAGEHRDNVELLIRSIETKLKTTKIPGEIPQAVVEEGLSQARRLLMPVFAELRQKSMRAHLRDRLVAIPTSRIN
jgi:hypothetical protein